jgi:lipopolysaccharide export system protein LptA
MKQQTIRKRCAVGFVALTATATLALSVNTKPVEAQQTIGTVRVYAQELIMEPGERIQYILLGTVAKPVTVTSPRGSISGTRIEMTMLASGKDVDTAEATGNVRIATRQPGGRIIRCSANKGTLFNSKNRAVLSGGVSVRSEDATAISTFTNVQTATIELDTKRISVKAPDGQQVSTTLHPKQGAAKG